jgi:phosphoribosylaminoimidazolecarboxamide formyltransferase/IMP cyclohydrolase
MKHVNPSGAAVTRSGDSLKDVYVKARDCDPRAAFGSVVTFNVELDAETADAIMSTFVECVVAPGFSDDAMAILNEGEQRKLNKSIRVIKCGDPKSLPRFSGEESDTHNTVKVLADGCLVVAAPLTTKLRSVADLKPAQGDSKKAGSHESEVSATPEQLEDLLAAWWINLNVRSNGVVIVKNGQTLAVGTGEQDRVGAVEQAIMKHKEKFEGPATLENAVMSSDGFFPFPDAVEVAAEAGVKAIVSPAGSLRDAEVVKRANELGVALYHAPERIFSHH